MFNPHSHLDSRQGLQEKAVPSFPTPCKVEWRQTRRILKFTCALGRVQTSVFRRCLIVLHSCTASPRRLGVGVSTACSTPLQSQKHFTIRQLNASFHAKEGGICCKPAAFPPAPLCQSVQSAWNLLHLKVTNIGRLVFFLVFHPSLPLACIISGFEIFLIYFFKRYSCCSLEASRKKLQFGSCFSLPARVQMRLLRFDTEGRPREATNHCRHLTHYATTLYASSKAAALLMLKTSLAHQMRDLLG